MIELGQQQQHRAKAFAREKMLSGLEKDSEFKVLESIDTDIYFCWKNAVFFSLGLNASQGKSIIIRQIYVVKESRRKGLALSFLARLQKLIPSDVTLLAFIAPFEIISKQETQKALTSGAIALTFKELDEVNVIALFEKAGFVLDDIYNWELTPISYDAEHAELIKRPRKACYSWAAK